MRRVARRLSPLDLDHAKQLLEAMRLAPARDAVALRQANMDFHFFYERCGMPELTAEIRGLWQAFPWDLLLSGSRLEASSAEHETILEAVAADPEAVATATEAHIVNGYAALYEHITGYPGPDPFDPSVD
jgi:DNA-binding GntR family transcriptional regulator